MAAAPPRPAPSQAPLIPTRTTNATVKPNSYSPPGPIGNTTGLIVPDTALNPTLNAAPAITPTPKEEGWWKRWGSDVTHGVLDVAGLVPVLGTVTGVVGAGIYALEGDYVSAGLDLASAVPIGGTAVKAGKLAVKASEKVLLSAEKQAAKKLAEMEAKKLAELEAKKLAEIEAKKLADAEAKAAKGGKDLGNPRCILRPFHPDTCKPRTGHHVVADRAFQIGGRDKGTRIPGPSGLPAMTEAKGLVICVDGGTPKKSNEHGQIHTIYDAAELAIGATSKVPGTASLLELELAGAAAAASVTKCNAVALAAQLRVYHQANGLGPDFVVRADKYGRISNLIPMNKFGSSGSGGF